MARNTWIERPTAGASPHRIVVAACLLVALLLAWGIAPAQADPPTGLLPFSSGYPRINYQNTSATATAYSKDTDLFSVDAAPTWYEPDLATDYVVKPPESVRLRIYIDATGNLTGGVAGDDLVVQGDVIDGAGGSVANGVLITGEILEYGFQDNASGSDAFNFRFTITGGLLADDFGGVGAQVGMTLGVEKSTFNGRFDEDFGGGAKGTVCVPEAARAALGDFVWQDINQNGLQDDGNTGLNGIPVDLYRDADGDGIPEPGGDDGAPLATQTTANFGGAPGYYLFSGLFPDDYFVVFRPGPAYAFTLQDVGSDNAIDSDAAPATGIAAVTTLVAGETDRTWDAGLIVAHEPDIHIEKATNGEDADLPTGPYVPVGNAVVWTYVVTNTGNVPLANIIVTDDNGTPDNTDDNFNPAPVLSGGFNVGDLDQNGVLDVGEAWQYTATLTGGAVAAQYENMSDVVGTAPDSSTVTDDDPSHYYGAQPVIHIEKATNGHDADTGPGPYVPVGDSVVWTYVVTNPGNVPLTNIIVTDDNGTLDNIDDFHPAPVLSGGFNVGDTNINNVLEPGEAWQYTATLTGGAIAGQYANLSDVSGEDPTGTTVTDDDPSHYYGEEILGAIGDLVWKDLNANGVQELSFELPFPGVTVNLYKTSDLVTPFKTATTDSNGLYLFDQLVPGLYVVEFIGPAGFLFSPKNRPIDLTVDSDADETTGRTGLIGLSAGQVDLKWDAGLIQASSLAGYVYHDSNDDGDRTGEAGIGGATVTLTGSDDLSNPVNQATTTAPDGAYRFANLRPGTYVLTETQPSGWLDGKDTIGSPGGTTTNDQFSNIVLPAGFDGVENNFGELLPGPAIDIEKYVSVDDEVTWHDADSPTGPVVLVGSDVYFKFVITNTGNVTLTHITLSDTDFNTGGCALADPLVPGASFECVIGPFSAIEGQHTDTGATTGDHDDGQGNITTVEDEDDANYKGVRPDIDIEKYVSVDNQANWHDADSPTGPQATPGDPVFFRLVVTNTGGVPLTTITLSDSDFVTSGCAIVDPLAVGASFTCILGPFAAIEGQHTDTATTSGQYTDEVGHTATVDDSDDANYFGEEEPSCKIVKTVKKVCAPCGPCVGKVTSLTLEYKGTEAARVKVYQKKPCTLIFDSERDLGRDLEPGEQFTVNGVDDKGTLSTEIKIYVDCHQNTTIHTSCSQPIGPGLVSGDFLVVGGTSLKGGELCPVDTPPSGDCGKCDGKVNWLKLQYNGSEAALIKVVQKDGKKVFEGTVQPGGQFEFSGQDKKGTLGTEIKVYKNCCATRIHTSCSQPIGPDMVFGDFTVVEGTSRNGGKLPRMGDPANCQPCQGPECDHEDEDGGGSGLCDAEDVRVGDTLVFTLTITTNAPTARTVEIRDYLDSALEVIEADNDGTLEVDSEGHRYVTWKVPVPADLKVTELTLKVKLVELPNNDNGECPEGWTRSNCVEVTILTSADSASADSTPTPGTRCMPAPVPVLENCACVNCAEPIASIGDRVWHDLNADGIQDDGEPGIPGVAVRLLDGLGTILRSTATDASGLYKFTDLTPGEYQVEFVKPDGSVFSPKDAGADDVDSDADTTTGQAIVTTLDAAENDMTWDAGLHRPPPEITIVKSARRICPTVECGPCDGKVTWLRLQYNGPAPATVEVVQKKDNVVAFGPQTVQPGPAGQFRFAGQDKKGTLSTEISIFVDGELNAKIHTSCSQPIGPGLVKGDFLVVAGASRNGGLLPPLGSTQAGECETEECDTSRIFVGDTLEFTLRISATGLPGPRQVEVRDKLDSSLRFLAADHGGQYVAAGHYVGWVLALPAGDSVALLKLRVKLAAPPAGDNGPCPPGSIASNLVELPVVRAERPLRNRACLGRPQEPPPPPDTGCTRTIGYWKTHADKWPVRRIKLGSVWFTSRSALCILWSSPKGKATLILARQLIAAKLNIAAGADPAAIAETIRRADEWLGIHPVGTRVSGPSREVGIGLAAILDAYNNGEIGPGECEGQGSF